jgi:ketosteroid isomerase-like protein
MVSQNNKMTQKIATNSPQTPTQKLIAWYAQLSPESLENIDQFYESDAKFKDPFNEVAGIQAIKKIFDHMFLTTNNPHFVFFNTIEQGNQAFVTWVFHFGLNGREYSVNGSSHLQYDENGLMTDHRDYWDAAEELWQKLPLIGGIVFWLRQKFQVK